jgi:hypothetical protein
MDGGLWHGWHDRGMRFVPATASPRETRTEHQLRRLLRTYPVSDWVFTRDIRIDATAIPHSHPVLTLNTRHLEDDHRLLGTFVHEQLHWGVSTLDRQLACELTHRYRDVQVGPPEGCRSAFSNYLHIVICTLEYHALITLLGATAARATVQRITHYKRIYQIVLADHDQLMPLIRANVELQRPCLHREEASQADLASSAFPSGA